LCGGNGFLHREGHRRSHDRREIGHPKWLGLEGLIGSRLDGRTRWRKG
jgi:hypothetical protein